MRLGLVALLTAMISLPAAIVTPEPVKVFAFQSADSANQVRIGGAAFSPNTIEAQNSSSNLRVSIATDTLVPKGATATVEVSESSNFGGVSYTVSPSRSQTVVLSGGGISTNVVFKFTTHKQNQDGGTIVSRVEITGATNASVGASATQDNLTLTVNSPGGGDLAGASCDQEPTTSAIARM